MTGHIIGWAHSAFGKREEEGVEELMGLVARDAIAHSGLAFEDIGAIYVGVFNAGFTKQDFPSSLVFQSVPELRYTPATRLENACATGSAAVHAGLNYVAGNRGKAALIVGAEKMTHTPGAQVGDNLLNACYRREEENVEGGFAGIFAQIAQRYFQEHGDRSEALARIAAKNHVNGMANPYAQLRKNFGFEFCNEVSDKNPIVAPPLRRTDCSLVSDGAAAIVVADAEIAMSAPRAVTFRGRAQVNDLLPIRERDITAFEGCRRAWQEALTAADLTLDDLDLVETHDCFTIAELIEYEAMGLAAPGEGHRAIEEGWVAKDGKLPVNVSGGLKAKGHPIGATGVSMHALCAMQLCGEAGEMQVGDATTAGIFNMGGAAVANFVSVLERSR
ncbi:MAG: acetyl-CoA acetyltransferase [Pseudomonadota bacterium]